MDSSITVRLDPRLAARLEQKQARLDHLRPLPPAVVQRLSDDMRVLLTYHSNAIEGNTLTLYETKMVIEEGVTISGQPLRYYLEARNHAEALDVVLINVATAKQPRRCSPLCSCAWRGMWRRFAGVRVATGAMGALASLALTGEPRQSHLPFHRRDLRRAFAPND